MLKPVNIKIILIFVLCCIFILITSKKYTYEEHMENRYNSFKNLIGGKIKIVAQLSRNKNKCVSVRVDFTKSFQEDSEKIPIIILTPFNSFYPINATIKEVTSTYFIANISILNITGASENALVDVNWLGIVYDTVVSPPSKEQFTIKANDFPIVSCDSGNLVAFRPYYDQYSMHTIKFNVKYTSVPLVYIQLKYSEYNTKNNNIYIANLSSITNQNFTVKITNMNYNYKYDRRYAYNSSYINKIQIYLNLQISWFAIYTDEPNLLYQLQINSLGPAANKKIDTLSTAEQVCSIYNSKLATKDQVIKILEKEILEKEPVQNIPDKNLCNPGFMSYGKNGVVGYVMLNNSDPKCGRMCTNGRINHSGYRDNDINSLCFNEIKSSKPINSNVWCYGPSNNITSNLVKFVEPSYKWDINNIYVKDGKDKKK